MRYLAARYGRFPFWPEDPVARAPVDMWAEWAKTTFQPSFLRPVFFPALTGQPIDPKARAAFERNLDILEAQLAAGPWLLGPDFTAADIEAGVALYRYFTVDLDRRDRPALAAYYDRLGARPAYAEHVMIDYAVLREMSSEWKPTTSSSAPAPPARPSPTASARPGARSSSSSTAAPTGAPSSRCRRRSPTR